METINRKAKIREAAKRLNPIDDLLFRKMTESLPFCQEILRVFLRNKDLVVKEAAAQYAMSNLQGRSVVADARCLLSDGTSVLIEVQKANDDDHQRRVRYNSSVLTANITDPGTKFKSVPDICSVFLSQFNLFGTVQALNHVQRTLSKQGQAVCNGWQEVYVSAGVDDGSETAQLMKIFTEDDAYDDDVFPETSGLKRQFKETEEGQQIMCEAMREIMEEVAREERAEGVKAGRIEGKMEALASLVRQGIITASEGARQAGMGEDIFAVHLSQNN